MYSQGLGTTSINHLPVDPFFSQLPPSLPSVGGLEAFRTVESFGNMERYLHPGFRMSPISVAAPASGFVPQSFPNISRIPAFDFGELEAAGRTYVDPRLLDLSLPSYPAWPHLPTAAASPSSNSIPFGLPFSTNPPLLDPFEFHSSPGHFPGPHHLTAPTSSNNIPSGIPPSADLPPLDPFELQLLAASSLNDLPECNLLTASSSSSSDDRLFDILFSTPSPPIPSEPQLSATSSPSDRNLTATTTPSSGQLLPFPTDHPLLDVSLPWGGTPDPPVASSASNNGPFPPDALPSSDAFDTQHRETPSARSGSHSPVSAEEMSDLSSGHNSPLSPMEVPVQAAPEISEGLVSQVQQSALDFMKDRGRGVFECSWSHGGDMACGFTGQASHVRRHIARVHLELK